MRDVDIMLSNFIRDPEAILFESMFFWLSLGKYDTVLSADFANYQYEEFIIISEDWKDQIHYVENIIPILVQRFIREKETLFTLDLCITFVIYTTPITARLIGLGIRIFTPTSHFSAEFAMTPEDKLQKIMYLLSRGLLKSVHHRIDQIECSLPV